MRLVAARFSGKRTIRFARTAGSRAMQMPRLLFPYMDEYPPVPYPEVDQQQNQFDCGVFAIAFATSLVFQKDPSLLEYDYSLMRSHLFEMFTQHNALIHFPIIREKEGSTTIFYNYLPKEIDIEI
uniref:Ubiquitin-like protease family profile domain-containing protein n=1 Tax=Trichogramma kaykai TaxID=54128 RepID=A0ABD2W2U1_9HYME